MSKISQKGCLPMEHVSKSLRLQIGIFGRTNVGKSSFLNMITSQDVSIVSPQPGTTTDVVEKAMEFLPVGPVVFLDTAGIDDDSQLSTDRFRRTAAIFGRADVFVVLTEEGCWGAYEAKLADEARERQVPLVVVVNKTDVHGMTGEFHERLNCVTPYVMDCSCAGGISCTSRDAVADAFKGLLTRCIDSNPVQQRALIGDLLPPNGLAILVVPIDTGAPRGRLILPQVQTIREVLDGNGVVMAVKESEYKTAMTVLNKRPDLVICDSQSVTKVAAETPPEIPLTTFSVLFARFKGDLARFARGTDAIGTLKAGDKVLISEACTHHAGPDDIGRVKIPNMLREHTGLGDKIQIDIRCGRDYPNNLGDYALIIHCGACMLTQREMASRINGADNKNVPITNYGMAISYFQGVLNRVIALFGPETQE